MDHGRSSCMIFLTQRDRPFSEISRSLWGCYILDLKSPSDTEAKFKIISLEPNATVRI